MAAAFATRNFSVATFSIPLGPDAARLQPGGMAIGDFNGDGKLDVLVENQLINPGENRRVPIVLLAGNGAGGFTDATSVLFGTNIPDTVSPKMPVVADFNGDGRADVFLDNYGYDATPFPGGQNGLILSSGATGLTNAVSRLPTLLDTTHSSTTGDIDGDGDIDIYVGNISVSPYFLINDGQGNFERTLGRIPTAIENKANSQRYTTSAFFDANGDGKVDLFLGSDGSIGNNGLILNDHSVILLNDGTGKFLTVLSNLPSPTAATSNTAVSGVEAALPMDLNGDGKLDLVIAFTLGAATPLLRKGLIQVMINQGDGTFVDETASRVAAPITNSWISFAQAVDLNGDGYQDVFLQNATNVGLNTPIYLNDGSGHLVQMPAGLLPGIGWRMEAADLNGDGRMDVFGADNNNGVYSAWLAKDPGLAQTGDEGDNPFMGDADNETFSALGGNDVIFAGGGNDTINGGAGNDTIDGGMGSDSVIFSGPSSAYSITLLADAALQVRDLRQGSPDGSDVVRNVEFAQFTDNRMALPTPIDGTIAREIVAVLRPSSPTAIDLAANLSGKLGAGTLTQIAALGQIVGAAGATSSVATLAYEFFTGKAPSAGGMDFLVSPTGPNPNNLNAAYYQSFSLENRYINFAVNLGKVGEGNAAFTAKYGGLTLFEATRTAYATIFGEPPSDAKLHAILDPTTVLNGVTFTRSDYFAYYGLDGTNGIGTKAAMVGYLLAEAVKADLGVYAKSNDAFLTDVALHNAPFGVDLVGVYNQPGFVFHPV
ncbi:MAG: FG-GAP-like repeat-containing protein [Caulobacteraceae bacterium]